MARFMAWRLGMVLHGVAEVADSDAVWGEDAAWGIPMLTAQGLHTLRIHILLCPMAHTHTTGDKKGNLIL